MNDITEDQLARAWTAVPPSHIHSIDRCAHVIEGREVHWTCGFGPMFTNVATARAVSEHVEVPLGATFVRGGGESVVVDAVIKRIADGILAACAYDDATPAGQQVVNAVWDARATVGVLGWAGIVLDPLIYPVDSIEPDINELADHDRQAAHDDAAIDRNAVENAEADALDREREWTLHGDPALDDVTYSKDGA